VAAFGVLAGASCALLSWAALPYLHHDEVNELAAPHFGSVPYIATSTSTYYMATSTPTRLVIPKLSIDAAFEIVGLNKDKTIGVPKGFATVGWYEHGAAPGAIGPTIILGHVDSKAGAAVFYHLGQLERGDTFTIERKDGTVAEFAVDSLERYSQDNFPSDKVYGPIGFAGIRLITCSGTYNHVTNRYDKNLVVYGHLVEPKKISSKGI
jgi:sortase (surface protein transpeptidase)